jgi:hypothetical protein
MRNILKHPNSINSQIHPDLSLKINSETECVHFQFKIKLTFEYQLSFSSLSCSMQQFPKIKSNLRKEIIKCRVIRDVCKSNNSELLQYLLLIENMRELYLIRVSRWMSVHVYQFLIFESASPLAICKLNAAHSLLPSPYHSSSQRPDLLRA